MTEEIKDCIGGECRPEVNWRRTDCPVHGENGNISPPVDVEEALKFDITRELAPLAIKPYKNPVPKMVCSACLAPATSDHAIEERHEIGCTGVKAGKFVWWFQGVDGNDYVHFERAGNCVCSLCKRRFGRHPMAHGPAALGHASEPYLHVLCDGALVKL